MSPRARALWTSGSARQGRGSRYSGRGAFGLPARCIFDFGTKRNGAARGPGTGDNHSVQLGNGSFDEAPEGDIAVSTAKKSLRAERVKRKPTPTASRSLPDVFADCDTEIVPRY